MMLVKPTDSGLYVNLLATNPLDMHSKLNPYRMHGIGKTLLDKAEALARINQLKRVYLWPDYPPSEGFYKSCGYSYDPSDICYMEKKTGRKSLIRTDQIMKIFSGTYNYFIKPAISYIPFQLMTWISKVAACSAHFISRLC